MEYCLPSLVGVRLTYGWQPVVGSRGTYPVALVVFNLARLVKRLWG